MVNFTIGVVQVSLLIRHARSLKDRRNVLKGLKQRLRNQGFSVAEESHEDSPKYASVGFAYVGYSPNQVEQAIEEGLRLFVGDYEVLDTQRDVFDYGTESSIDFQRAEEEDPRA